MSRVIRWHIVTGEYPPQPGGVSDYTQLLARGLVSAGDEVDVWAPEYAGPTEAHLGITVHRLPGHFGPRALVRLDRALRRNGSPTRLLVQYVPHMYGCKAMNLAFCAWLLMRRKLAPWVMFHEVVFPCNRGERWRHQFLGAVTYSMAAMVARAAEHIFVSIPAWERLLRGLIRVPGPITWLPVPSNVATEASPEAVALIRRQVAPDPGTVLLGYFGTFGGQVADFLAQAVPKLLADHPERRALLLGRGSQEFVERLRKQHALGANRLLARADLASAELAAHLASCDLLLQPYPDGVSSRRGSVMAGLALGQPIVTTEGHLTEPVWGQEQLAGLVPAGDLDAFTAAAERLLARPEARRQLGLRARTGYEEYFSLRRTIEQLRAGA
jgi:glycosyltransferase involved in cell wall biosynthesis